jgi:hypothetical protein
MQAYFAAANSSPRGGGEEVGLEEGSGGGAGLASAWTEGAAALLEAAEARAGELAKRLAAAEALIREQVS